MPLPRKPERSQPIPNQPFESPEVTTVKGPYWEMALSNGLETDPDGSIQTSGSEPSAPTAYLYGANGFVGVGAGLQVSANGEFETSSAYIYCTPQFSHLPVTYPPYSCETEVNTAGVTDFTDAWNNCDTLTDFPCVDTSSGTYFGYTWYNCDNMATFPRLDLSSGTSFGYTWGGCTSLTSFPLLDVSKGENFEAAWAYCTSLTTFPLLDFSNATNLGDTNNINFGAWENCEGMVSFPKINTSKVELFDYTWNECYALESFPEIDTSKGTSFLNTWSYCQSLTSFPALDFSSGDIFSQTWDSCINLETFPAGVFDNCLATTFDYAWQNCALSQQSVDNILVSLNTAGQSNGIVNIDGGTSAAPSSTGLAAKASLEGKGWTVTVNAEPLSHKNSLVKVKRIKTNKRTRNRKGQFLGDIPGTPENEAWIYTSEVPPNGN